MRRITRIGVDEEGKSYFEEIDIPLKDGGDIGLLSEAFPVKSIIFRRTESDYDYDWHNAPRRQFIIMQKGGVEITAGSGETRTFTTGDILLVEDTHGGGHISRAVNNEPRDSIFVTLE
ncbi:hypothetical protein [Limisalsivibrio acetivorans]|uniref:hypothetical protein n=1 Tax=Limisalsivibrio acetivorans TaxID=1304888 RepID=UPI0004793F32|nr:hypothetical protein [Limisalsivibrio acetivorans]